MRVGRTSLVGVLVASTTLIGVARATEAVETARQRARGSCLTEASERGVPAEAARLAQSRELVGSGSLWTLVDAVRVTAEEWAAYRRPDGRWFLKVPWIRLARGSLVIDAHRRAGGGTFLAETHEESYPPTGFLPSGLYFSRTGCWRVKASLGSSTTSVLVKIPAKAATLG
jgi:hypothetical protein